MRLISVDALLTLVKLKESAEAGVTSAKIRSILVPIEHTRLDGLVDVMFTAAKEVEAAVEAGNNPEPNNTIEIDDGSSGWQFTDPALIQAKREHILGALSARDGQKLIKRSRALYWARLILTGSPARYRSATRRRGKYRIGMHTILNGTVFWSGQHCSWSYGPRHCVCTAAGGPAGPFG